ncbi:hypothetical protein [Streptomyces mangrovisoli]|uniref:Uncharacterized protein n=1 Tax=Streptomyces mangrovisoli TaxID=1428628 RepID=A0A1J4P1Z9_9ACTN|nr:hypothetical protein [Streptomyces mangrovisoli]OIJ68785.1 hypothetical protein WN71_006220 [Streptomyces mangrovisoli]
MAEHDSDREDREGREDREDLAEREGLADREGPEDREGGADPQRGGEDLPLDEDAAWAAIVAGYGEEPPDPPGTKPFKPVRDLALPEADVNAAGTEGAATAAGEVGDVADEAAPEPEPPGPARSTLPLGGSVSFAPGVGPRDHTPAEPADDDEGHFVPPEPPPLPEADTTAKFAWLGVVGGPVLLLLAVILGWDMTWWLTTLGVGGFLGGFATLVARMRPDDEDNDDPGRGAVV